MIVFYKQPRATDGARPIYNIYIYKEALKQQMYALSSYYMRLIKMCICSRSPCRTCPQGTRAGSACSAAADRKIPACRQTRFCGAEWRSTSPRGKTEWNIFRFQCELTRKFCRHETRSIAGADPETPQPARVCMMCLRGVSRMCCTSI